jgi:transposase
VQGGARGHHREAERAAVAGVGAMTARQSEIAELRGQGLSIRKIAKRLGVTFASVYQSARLAGLDTTRIDAISEPHHFYDERPRDVRARIQADIEAGKRCRTCWLLLPCEDHQP